MQMREPMKLLPVLVPTVIRIISVRTLPATASANWRHTFQVNSSTVEKLHELQYGVQKSNLPFSE